MFTTEAVIEITSLFLHRINHCRLIVSGQAIEIHPAYRRVSPENNNAAEIGFIVPSATAGHISKLEIVSITGSVLDRRDYNLQKLAGGEIMLQLSYHIMEGF